MKSKFINYLLVLSIIVCAFFFALNFMAFNDSFYAYEYELNNVKEVIGISSEDLNRATDVLLDYIKDDIDSLDVEVMIDGKFVQMYNQREIDHMVDVKDLYILVKNIAYSALVISLLCLSYLIMSKSHDKWTKLYRDSLEILTTFLAVIAGLAILAITDFTKFWHGFHKIFFTNDLWLLDPRTDNLINMVPSKFFFDLIFTMMGFFASILVIYFMIVRYLKMKEICK